MADPTRRPIPDQVWDGRGSAGRHARRGQGRARRRDSTDRECTTPHAARIGAISRAEQTTPSIFSCSSFGSRIRPANLGAPVWPTAERSDSSIARWAACDARRACRASSSASYSGERAGGFPRGASSTASAPRRSPSRLRVLLHLNRERCVRPRVGVRRRRRRPRRRGRSRTPWRHGAKRRRPIRVPPRSRRRRGA